MHPQAHLPTFSWNKVVISTWNRHRWVFPNQKLLWQWVLLKCTLRCTSQQFLKKWSNLPGKDIVESYLTRKYFDSGYYKNEPPDAPPKSQLFLKKWSYLPGIDIVVSFLTRNYFDRLKSTLRRTSQQFLKRWSNLPGKDIVEYFLTRKYLTLGTTKMHPQAHLPTFLKKWSYLPGIDIVESSLTRNYFDGVYY